MPIRDDLCYVAVLCLARLAAPGLAVAAESNAAQPLPEASVDAVPAAPVAPVTPEVASYDIGLVLGRQLYQSGLADRARQDDLLRGLKEGLAGKVATPEQRVQANAFIKAGRDDMVERNQRAAREFLDENAKVPGVHVTASGLQYRVLAEGDAAAHPPGPTDEVTVQYRAALIDGVEFDSSSAHGRPATLQMSSIIKGWREALSMMHPGAHWKLFVPPELAYGSAPPPAVPPGSLLVYDLELLRVEPPRHIEPAHPAPR